MQFEDFWYIVALSEQLNSHTVLARTVLDEWLVIFRDQTGQPVALRDRCLHRHSRLSPGKVCRGQLHCPYHGWVYNSEGQVVAVPAEGESFQPSSKRRAKWYATKEQDGYVYIRLAAAPPTEFAPFPMPHYQESGWQTVRVINRFHNTVTNCAENFIDIPHTVSVHPGIFRTRRQQPIEMLVERRDGSVWVEYRNETNNLGWFSRFLNQKGAAIKHRDRFQMPNITCVEYRLGPQRQLYITSQSIPETAASTLVYTDVTYNYGIWNWLARPFVWWTAQRIIHQDVKILDIQAETIAKYGSQFAHTPVDTIHIFVESIREAIAAGKDPRQLPMQSVRTTFWV
ncbi:Rieske 2Fe-2S domain-containing protein [Pantanalinema sp. GBBB05]|uniref:aromatic ring-hydroxylating dioxygenase subunit alpha n=1 Tax=Pantanalinema sp. GBBB05 TaxID=2604139 RepID=UPI001E14B130|nr:aromatic ring-hydroxylating dioxygenase subunit alpha [Pantanalinema sp. GBBB05]